MGLLVQWDRPDTSEVPFEFHVGESLVKEIAQSHSATCLLKGLTKMSHNNLMDLADTQ